MADVGSARVDPIEIGLIEPYAMAQGQARHQKAEAVDVVERGPATAAARVFLLVGGLDDVHVHRRFTARREIGKHLEGGIRAAVQVGGSQLDLDPLLVVVLGMEMLERSAVICQAQRKTGEMTL